eukprot:m.17880 g.17880  ORF g.17880 m.17880 type:complete len:277 (+) comp5570_c0_seq1:275-1105(+)
MFGMEDLPALDAPDPLGAFETQSPLRHGRTHTQQRGAGSRGTGVGRGQRSRSSLGAGSFTGGSPPRRFGHTSLEDESAHVVQLHKLKILLVGDVGTGKSSLVHRLVARAWSPKIQPTIGVDYAVKTMQCAESGDIIHLHLWDVGGHERSGQRIATSVYYRHAHGAFVVFDATRPQTFDSVLIWKENIEAINGDIPVVLLANKSDEADVEQYNLASFAAEHRFAGYFETSALEGTNVLEGVETLTETILRTSLVSAGPTSVKLCEHSPDLRQKEPCC